MFHDLFGFIKSEYGLPETYTSITYIIYVSGSAHSNALYAIMWEGFVFGCLSRISARLASY